MFGRMFFTALALSFVELSIFVGIASWDESRGNMASPQGGASYEALAAILFGPWVFFGIFPAFYLTIHLLSGFKAPAVPLRVTSYLLLALIVLYLLEHTGISVNSDDRSIAMFLLIYIVSAFVIYIESLAYVKRKSDQ
jgi:hypothetical protein